MIKNQLEYFIEKNWHPKFKVHRMKTRFFPISHAFYQYLLQDGTFIHPKYTKNYDSQNDQYHVQENIQNIKLQQQQENDINLNIPEFPQIQTFIKKCLEQFDSKIFVKVNWKTGKDCLSWLPELKCTHIQDVFMLLKCSEYISEILVDYSQLFNWNQNCGNLYLTIRQYWALDKSMQFRCFVRNNKHISICQRNTEAIYQQLIQKEKELKQKILMFIEKQIIQKFEASNFVVDLYLEKQKIYIIDFNPWREFTNPLMFSWQDLQKYDGDRLQLIKSKQQMIYEDLSNYKIPAQFTGDMGDLKDMIKQLKKNMGDIFY